MPTVGVVGLGAMGRRIALRLLESGHAVVVWNRDPAKAEPLVARGAATSASPAEAARASDAVITMVTGPRALAEVTEGEDGVAAGAGAETTVIQMSTVSPEATARLATVVGEARLLDAPVLGSISEVDSGTLKIFAGGTPALVDRWAALLGALGTVLNVGPVGAGTVAKLVANATLVGLIGVLGEALLVADSLQLPRERTFEVLAVTPLAAQAERRRPAVEAGEYPPRFTLSLARKDADLILAAVPQLRLVAAARDWLADAEAAGLGDRDYSAVLALMLDSSATGSHAASSDK
jgi:3-hydroxyisobutyrate dehydrogenase/2-hydroxy-3-oxopropionate reductase